MNMNLYAYGKPSEQKWIIIDTGVTLFELAPSLTDKVAFSLMVPVLLAATGALLAAAVIIL